MLVLAGVSLMCGEEQSGGNQQARALETVYS